VIIETDTGAPASVDSASPPPEAVGAHPTSAMVAAAMTAVARYFFVTRM